MNNEKASQKNETQNKRMIAVCILDILSKNVGTSEKLMYDDIIRELKKYQIFVHRKAIHENIDALINLQDSTENKPLFHIEYDTKTRIVNGQEQKIRTNFRMKDPLDEYRLTDGELIMISDYIKNNKALDSDEANMLIEKLIQFADKNTCLQKSDLIAKDYYEAPNSNIYDWMIKIQKAIANKKQITVKMCKYNLDKMLVSDGVEITLDPYKTTLSQGKPYLIAAPRGANALSGYRIDLIYSLAEENTDRRERPEQDIERFIYEHPWLSDAEAFQVTLYVREGDIGKVIDAFGTNIEIDPTPCSDIDAVWEDYHLVKLKASSNAIINFVLQNTDCMEIVAPQIMRDRIIAATQNIAWDYNASYEDRYTAAILAVKYSKKLNVENVDLSTRYNYYDLKPEEASFKKTNLSSIDFLKCDSYNNQLYDLSIIDNPLSNITPISSLKKLRHLTLAKTQVDNLSALKLCPELCALTLVDNPITDYSVLAELTNLRMLSIGAAEKEKIDVEALCKIFPKLRVSDANVKSLSQISEWQRVEHMSMSRAMRDVMDSKRPRKRNNTPDGCHRYEQRKLK